MYNDDAVRCSYVDVDARKFLRIGNSLIPVDRIKEIDLDPPNGGCDNSVRIITDDPEDDFIWAYKNADAIREFLNLPTKRDERVGNAPVHGSWSDSV